MGTVKDLTSAEAVEKIKTLVHDADVCMFTTSLHQLPLSSRPMSTSKVDDEGNLWFLSKKSSDKNREIEADEKVQLFYASKGNAEYLSVYGDAAIIIDRTKAEELWSSIDKAWFPGGVDDPELTIIKVTPLDSYYWDTKHNKFVSLLKIASAAVSGNANDGDGIEGNISV
jgi:general stress protein 26